VTTLQQQIQASLGDDYEVERELGGGGMSRVFVARDLRLDRRVVLKLLRSELAAGVSIDRFRREILLAASLQHPLIVPVLAAGEIDGLPYFLMPFVEGESLRTKIQRTGMMSVPESVRILRDVARALAVAHARGVVHRDIKPDNVLLAHEAAVVADFGVAKAFASACAGDDTPSGSHHAITTIGTSLGTPAYMAPEQVAADPDAGHGIDIYAFGVMAYEMLTGAAPFAGRPPQAIMAAQITEKPEHLDARRPGLPAALSALVMQCLEKDARERPPSASALVDALDDPAVVSGSFTPFQDERPGSGPFLSGGAALASAASVTTAGRGRGRFVLLGVAVLVLVLAAGAFAAWRKDRGNQPTNEPTVQSSAVTAIATSPSVAVMPFVYLGEDSTQAWTAKAVADAITNGLSQVRGLRVASQSAAASLQRRIATGDSSALPVRTLVEGVLENEGGRLRLSVRLVDAGDGFTLFADRYEGEVGNLFTMEDRIAAAIREMLREHFSLPSPDRASRQKTL
jgi:serine/threonine-protein kinase